MLFPCYFVAPCVISFVRKLIAWMSCFTTPILQVSTLTFAQLYYVCCVGHASALCLGNMVAVVVIIL